jgi:hypothetical protein
MNASRFGVVASAAVVALALTGCAGNRDEQIAEVARTGFDVACSDAGGYYQPPTWPSGETAARCVFMFPNLPEVTR